MPAFAGVRGTGDWGTDERPKDFRETIMFLNPNGTAPIFALTSKMGTQAKRDPEFSWWDEPNDIYRFRINGARTNAQTQIIVDSSDPDAANLDARYGSPKNLVAGDLLMVEPTSDAANFSPEIMMVTAPSAASLAAPDTQFTVTRGAVGTNAANIADNQYLLKIGNAFEEGTRAPGSATRNPVKYSNYTQIFKTTYELTGTVMQTYARTGDPEKNDKKRKMFDHAQSIEWSILFGHKSEGNGSGGKPLRTFDGIRRFIPNKILGNNWNLSSLLTNVSPVFDWNTPAGDERLVFCGNGALNAFNNKIVGQSGNAVQVTYEGESKMYGMNFRTYMVPQGKLHIKTHPLLSRHPLYTNSWLVIDGSCLKWCPLRNRDTKFKDNIQHNDEDTKKGMWLTEGGIQVDKGGLTMMWVGGFGN